jgi:hypothetical protein
MNTQTFKAEFQADKAMLAERGVILYGVEMYTPPAWKGNIQLAMDAQPVLATDPNSAIPALLTTVIDPDLIRVLFAPLAFADILGERKKGDWLTETELFPVIEHTGEVSTYGDFNNNGRAGVNMNWPQFQSYLFQTFVRTASASLPARVSRRSTTSASCRRRRSTSSTAIRTSRTPTAFRACRTTAS